MRNLLKVKTTEFQNSIGKSIEINGEIYDKVLGTGKSNSLIVKGIHKKTKKEVAIKIY